MNVKYAVLIFTKRNIVDMNKLICFDKMLVMKLALSPDTEVEHAGAISQSPFNHTLTFGQPKWDM